MNHEKRRSDVWYRSIVIIGITLLRYFFDSQIRGKQREGNRGMKELENIIDDYDKYFNSFGSTNKNKSISYNRVNKYLDGIL